MRWTSLNPKYGDLRVKVIFLFLPKTLNGETRWLEWATVRQVYKKVSCFGPTGIGTTDKWVSFNWV